MTGSPYPRVEINGHTATAEDLRRFVMVSSYGHFTAMQVRNRAVRGLDFHLDRLATATQELYGTGLDGERVLDAIRHALWDDVDASVRVNVFRPDPNPRPADEVSLLVSVRGPGAGPSGPQSLMSVEHQRPVAHVKHVGGFGQGYFGNEARAAGFDEALLVGHGGVISEGSITNIGFADGDSVVWPDAPALHGITMRVIEREMTAAGLPWRHQRVLVADVPSFDGAFVCNSRGIAPVSRLDDLVLPTDAGLVKRVIELFESARWDAL
ncbi:aminotransferase class IV [Streptomyces sp. H10-C2]|uniref:aminotransferase class IV n=1 Tax=unclassified Streptomyces TaxID=2593676 RepID=UPI0024BAD15A|nr:MULTISPECIES: aminotransferase class IV [unclassified Streptomyces]MDJ0344546.1 aminotransferase class IV [Streptomyces sp. PH10-H1]MDJ0371045.1 aminotransferase class IV [Streptomyces sp. H10-C2]